MKKVVLFLLIILINVFVFSQTKNLLENSAPFESRPAFLPCLPEFHCNYYDDEIIRKPMQHFQFQKLHFETRIDYYLIVSIEIDASGMATVNIKDSYFERTTTIRRKMYRFEFEHLLSAIARCDFDNFIEEAVEDDSCCCNSYIEISFNNQTVRARNNSFFPINDRDLRIILSRKLHIPMSHDRVVLRTDY